jgi:hypothetical protein
MRAIRQGLREERAPPLVTKHNRHDPGEGSQIAGHCHHIMLNPVCAGIPHGMLTELRLIRWYRDDALNHRLIATNPAGSDGALRAKL